MVAKNKPNHTPGQVTERVAPDIREIFGLHLRDSQRLKHLDEEAAELRASGKIGQARQVMAQTAEVRRCLAALEREVRPVSPHAS
jgi:hypothetical protein